ncbi:hypothetical protein KDW_15330 [Dictyobacter vulcani]|uniref:Peptidase C39-like domain-containing protein n=1 Tax=Dictyobacter vulcani TaxID=2607529 RepID=A0A5J4KM91_9CHLR|nr:C39 family peptidase [Dictyobacter vulcani]GER87371.1 hypothetical protein KDW_15330 [Dictyobacter vulcani]
MRSFPGISDRNRRNLFCFCLLSLFVSGATLLHTIQPSLAGGIQQYNEFWQQQSGQDFQHWQQHGVSVTNGMTAANVQLDRQKNLACNTRDIDGGSVSYVEQVGLCQGKDPYPARGYVQGQNYYNGGAFYFGTLTSPINVVHQPFTSLVASWNATTPAGTWLEFHVRVLEKRFWTHWYRLPIWASDSSMITRHSNSGQSDRTGAVETDTFVTGKQPARAYQIAVTLFSMTANNSPHLKRVSVIASYDTNAQTTPVIAPLKAAWGINLAVPQRSQMLDAYRQLGFGGGGEAWCSPTSTSMVMAYWAQKLGQADLRQAVPDAARASFDYTYQGTGNWPFNTAYAGSYNLKSFVTRLYSMSQVESWIQAGIPLVISVAYQPGALPDSPIASSTGHLLVVRGFTPHGDVITNDPAASSDDHVQIIYSRTRLQTVWLNASHGTVYVIYPEKWLIPTLNRLNSW